MALDPCNGSEERFASLTISLDNDGDGLYDMDDPDCQSVPTITTASPLTAGMVGAAYSQTLAASGGTTPYSWSVSAGTLPAGLSLSATGVLSGTPTAAGTSNFTVQVTGGGSSTKDFSLTINAVAAPTITTNSPLTAGSVGAAYSQTLAASGGTTPYSWSVSAGALPSGLSLNASTGELSGTPTAAGTYDFTIQVTGGGSSTKAFSLTISAAPDTTAPVVNSTDPPNTQTGVPANAVLTVTFSEAVVVPAGSFTLSDGAGSVPGTVSVNGATVTFTPSAILSDNTTYTATITTAVTDAAGNPLAASYSSTFTTNAATPSPVLDLENSGGGGCAIARSGGGIGDVAGAYGLLIVSALGMAIRRRVKRKAK